MHGDTIRLVLPAGTTYLDIALGLIATLAERSSLDPDGVAGLLGHAGPLLEARVIAAGTPHVRLGYEVGEGFLGLRVEGVTS